MTAGPAAAREPGGAHADPRGAEWKGPLAGLRALELTRVLAGPLAAQILRDLSPRS